MTPTSSHTSDQGKPAIFVILGSRIQLLCSSPTYYQSKVSKQEQKRGQQWEWTSMEVWGLVPTWRLQGRMNTDLNPSHFFRGHIQHSCVTTYCTEIHTHSPAAGAGKGLCWWWWWCVKTRSSGEGLVWESGVWRCSRQQIEAWSLTIYIYMI